MENLDATCRVAAPDRSGGAAVRSWGRSAPARANAQVELYQNGDVDVLVATDAIGMGLNLDIRHVAFFRPAQVRRATHARALAQRAGTDRGARGALQGGRAPFGVTGEAPRCTRIWRLRSRSIASPR